jgi:hypothetical protein
LQTRRVSNPAHEYAPGTHVHGVHAPALHVVLAPQLVSA